MKPLFYIILFLAVIVAANAWCWPPRQTAIEHSATVNYSWQRRIEQTRPEIVMFGNSMLKDAVNDELLSRLLETSAIKLTFDGSASAMWYLWMKNLIAPAAYKPRWVVYFFRDHYLTEPGFRVDNEFKKRIDAFAQADEPVLDRLAYLDRMDTVTYGLYRFCPLFQKRENIKGQFKGAVKDASARLLGLEAGQVDEAIKEVFRNRHMDQALLSARQLEVEAAKTLERYDFADKVNRSFLPYMIEDAQQSGVKLMFVRVKRRQVAEGKGEPAHLPEYIEALRRYLEDRDVALIDFTYDERIGLEYFGAGDHLTKTDGRLLFTHLLAEKMAPLVKSGG